MTRKLSLFVAVLLLSAGLGFAQGTGFTYQGFLGSSNSPANGPHDFRFQLYGSSNAGPVLTAQLTQTNVAVSNGLFRVTLDFGAAPFNGQLVWMEVGVRYGLYAPPPAAPPPFAVQAPRVPLAPTPYAIFATSASNAVNVAAGSVSAASVLDGSLTATKLGSGQVVKSVNGLKDAVSLTAGANVAITTNGNSLQIAAAGGGGVSNAWLLAGNAGTTSTANFLGSTDGARVRLHSTGGFLLDDTTPSLAFGATRRQMINLWGTDNGIGVQDYTIYSRVASSNGGGGFAWYLGGVHSNTRNDPGPGGTTLMTLDPNANLTVNGAVTASSFTSTGPATLSGGVSASSFKLGASSTLGAVLTAGDAVGDSQWQPGLRVLETSPSGLPTSTRLTPNVVGGSPLNTVNNNAVGATISGGGDYTTGLHIGPLVPNVVAGSYGTVSGGSANLASGNYSTVSGGYSNTAAGQYSFAAGRRAQANHPGSFVWTDSQNAEYASTTANEFSVRAAGGVRFGGGGPLYVDADALNTTGVLGQGLIFGGPGSGEGIVSTRDNTGNAWGLDFYTAFTPRMSIANNGSVGIGTQSPTDGILDVEGDTHINDHDLFLRAGSDRNHGLGWYGSGKQFAGQDIDGPVLYGWSGGALGGMGPQSISLQWDYQGNVWVNHDLSTSTLTIRGGADLAEPFPMSSDIPKGAVMVIDEDHPGQLKLSQSAYDRRVAGIVSGANGVSPGITLHQEGKLEGGQNVALSGRVYALADAAQGAIQAGDLLTTSDTPGHVMRVTDHARAQGSIVGKAMSSLKAGRGYVLVLVSLQ